MILGGNTNIKDIAKWTGLLEVDVIHIRNSILKRKKAEKALEKGEEGEIK